MGNVIQRDFNKIKYAFVRLGSIMKQICRVGFASLHPPYALYEPRMATAGGVHFSILFNISTQLFDISRESW